MIQLIKSDNSIIQFNDDVNYWWVNQGINFNYEYTNGFIECRDNGYRHYHLTLEVTEIDDIVIHYADMYISAISVIIKKIFFPTDHSGRHRRNECQYYLLRNSIHRDTARNILQKGLGAFP